MLFWKRDVFRGETEPIPRRRHALSFESSPPRSLPPRQTKKKHESSCKLSQSKKGRRTMNQTSPQKTEPRWRSAIRKRRRTEENGQLHRKKKLRCVVDATVLFLRSAKDEPTNARLGLTKEIRKDTHHTFLEAFRKTHVVRGLVNEHSTQSSGRMSAKPPKNLQKS